MDHPLNKCCCCIRKQTNAKIDTKKVLLKKWGALNEVSVQRARGRGNSVSVFSDTSFHLRNITETKFVTGNGLCETLCSYYSSECQQIARNLSDSFVYSTKITIVGTFGGMKAPEVTETTRLLPI